MATRSTRRWRWRRRACSSGIAREQMVADGGMGIRLGAHVVPVDASGRQLIDQYGPEGTLPTHSLLDLLRGDIDPGLLRRAGRRPGRLGLRRRRPLHHAVQHPTARQRASGDRDRQHPVRPEPAPRHVGARARPPADRGHGAGRGAAGRAALALAVAAGPGRAAGCLGRPAPARLRRAPHLARGPAADCRHARGRAGGRGAASRRRAAPPAPARAAEDQPRPLLRACRGGAAGRQRRARPGSTGRRRRW